MSYLTWYNSPHFIQKRNTEDATSVIEKPINRGRTIPQIEAELRGRPENNAINENELYHKLDIAIELARQSGTLEE